MTENIKKKKIHCGCYPLEAYETLEIKIHKVTGKIRRKIHAKSKALSAYETH